jgi:hypothetical protein
MLLTSLRANLSITSLAADVTTFVDDETGNTLSLKADRARACATTKHFVVCRNKVCCIQRTRMSSFFVEKSLETSVHNLVNHLMLCWQEVQDHLRIHLTGFDICDPVEGDIIQKRINLKGYSVHPNLRRGAHLGNE